MINVTVWNENIHEQQDKAVQDIYPLGMHQTIADFLSPHLDMAVSTATMEQSEHGLSQEKLDETNVLIWWAHKAHDRVDDRVVDRIQTRVLEGMGFIALHSAHYSKPLKRLLGTNCSLKWREIGEKERLWNIEPGHPISAGIGQFIELPHTEMYGERFDIPQPDKVVFISWFPGGEVFRSGCCWERGHGRIFYFRPGHETYPIFHNLEIQKVITNAVRWAAPRITIVDECPNVEPIE